MRLTYRRTKEIDTSEESKRPLATLRTPRLQIKRLAAGSTIRRVRKRAIDPPDGVKIGFIPCPTNCAKFERMVAHSFGA